MFIFYEETSFVRDPSTEVLAHHNPSETVRDPSLGESETGKKGNSAQAAQLEPLEVVDPTIRLSRTPWPGPRFWRYASPHPFSLGIMLRGFVQPVMMMRNLILLWCALQFGMYQVYFNCEYFILIIVPC